MRKKRHYKKDSRFLLDLYTLTFDEDEEVEEIPTCKTSIMINDYMLSNSTPSSPTATRAKSFLGKWIVCKIHQFLTLTLLCSSDVSNTKKSNALNPKYSVPPTMSLGLTNALAVAKPSIRTTKTIPSLETNLHKILARKFQDSEEVSFRKAKLLTKAYYQLLRSNHTDASMASEIHHG